MWCTRCKKKFCQLCMKPVSFIPVHMHLFVCKGKQSFKDNSFSYFLSIFFLTFVFLLKNNFQSYWHILTLLLMYYCLHMFFDWIESLNVGLWIFFSILTAMTAAVIINIIIINALGLQITVRVAY